jgi:hypothetical protein
MEEPQMKRSPTGLPGPPARWSWTVVLAIIASSVTGPAFGQGAGGKADSGPFAVLELFTSESSITCPPADSVVAVALAEASQAGQRVYGLAFHVDIWNSLGWTDLYSDPEYSRRLRMYNWREGLNAVRTPYLVVNGLRGFIPRDTGGVLEAIAQGQSSSRPVDVSIQNRFQSSTANVDYKLPRAFPGYLLNIAVVEKGVQVYIASGENLGDTLTHNHLVRAFHMVILDGKTTGQAVVRFPEDVVLQNASVIAYLQDATTFEILGVAESP